MQASALDPNPDRLRPHTKLQKLRSPDNPLLPLRKLCDHCIPGVSRRFWPFKGPYCQLAAHIAKPEATRCTRGAHFVPIPSRKTHQIQAPAPTPTPGNKKRPQSAVAASGFDPFM